MPRTARERGESGVYHVTIRGINQSQLFYDDDDRRMFLRKLSRYKEECGFCAYAWSLMGNHVHLLVREGDVSLSGVMKKILLSYSHYFNDKYDRSGYLYQGRYGSKPIDGDSYFLAALRYIHRNPLEIGESVRFWTSFDEYMGVSNLADTAFALGMFSNDSDEAKHLFRAFVEDAAVVEDFGFGDGHGRMRDAAAIEAIKSVACVSDCVEVCGMNREALAEVLPELKRRGLTVRQIARLTGLNRGVVQRIR